MREQKTLSQLFSAWMKRYRRKWPGLKPTPMEAWMAGYAACYRQIHAKENQQL